MVYASDERCVSSDIKHACCANIKKGAYNDIDDEEHVRNSSRERPVSTKDGKELGWLSSRKRGRKRTSADTRADHPTARRF
jgi:hypothetical protein